MFERVQQLEQQVLEALPNGLFIGGEWVQTDNLIPVENPAKGEAFAEVADATPEQAMQALDAAAEAQAGWAATKPRDRAELLRRVFDMINQRRELFAALMTMEMGKTFNEALGEVAYGNEYVRWFSEQACRIEGYNSIAPSSGRRIHTEKVPVGPVLAITPWNFPLAMATRKIAPRWPPAAPWSEARQADRDHAAVRRCSRRPGCRPAWWFIITTNRSEPPPAR